MLRRECGSETWAYFCLDVSRHEWPICCGFLSCRSSDSSRKAMRAQTQRMLPIPTIKVTSMCDMDVIVLPPDLGSKEEQLRCHESRHCKPGNRLEVMTVQLV